MGGFNRPLAAACPRTVVPVWAAARTRTTVRMAKLFASAVLLSACLAPPAMAADVIYRAELSSTPLTMATRPNLLGKGLVAGALSGRTLKVDGRYQGLPSDATRAHLKAAVAMGVPGETFAELQVSGNGDGAVTGTVALTPRQLKYLRAGGVSIVIDSVNAPDGNVWGWLAPPAPQKP